MQSLIRTNSSAKAARSRLEPRGGIYPGVAQIQQQFRRGCPSRVSQARARPQEEPDAPAVADSVANDTFAASTLSRTLFAGSQSQQTLRNTLSQRPSIPGGSVGAVAFTLTFMITVQKMFWYLIVKRTLDCPDCRGFGIARCELCHASGSVKWIGKWDHVEPCPECMGKRYHRCYSCGGLYHRPIFAHVRRNAGVNASQNQVYRTVDVVNPLVD